MARTSRQFLHICQQQRQWTQRFEALDRAERILITDSMRCLSRSYALLERTQAAAPAGPVPGRTATA